MRIALLAAAAGLILTWTVRLEAGPFSNLVVFGDSLSDVGNWPAVLGIPDPPHYYQGRHSNGPVWVDALAEELGLPPLAASGAGGLGYAFAAARTGAGNDRFSGYTIPRVGAQINAYLSTHQPSADELFVVLAGHNDFGWGQQTRPAIPLANLSAHIQALAAAGAKHILVPNLLALGSAPEYLGTAREAPINQRIGEFNALLADELESLERDLGIDIYPADFGSVLQESLANPATFGLTNVTAPAWVDGEVVANPQEYLFWDTVHPTTEFHLAWPSRQRATCRSRLA